MYKRLFAVALTALLLIPAASFSAEPLTVGAQLDAELKALRERPAPPAPAPAPRYVTVCVYKITFDDAGPGTPPRRSMTFSATHDAHFKMGWCTEFRPVSDMPRDAISIIQAGCLDLDTGKFDVIHNNPPASPPNRNCVDGGH